MKTRKKKADARFINEEYLAYVHENAPKTKQLKTLIPAFLVGGTICSIGQIVSDLLKMWTSLDKEGIGAATSVILIFLGSLFTGLGLYDRLGRIAGGGSIVPITGFANSIVSPAMEFHSEGFILGTAANMFKLAGPVIVFGCGSAVVYGLIIYIFGWY